LQDVLKAEFSASVVPYYMY